MVFWVDALGLRFLGQSAPAVDWGAVIEADPFGVAELLSINTLFLLYQTGDGVISHAIRRYLLETVCFQVC